MVMRNGLQTLRSPTSTGSKLETTTVTDAPVQSRNEDRIAPDQTQSGRDSRLVYPCLQLIR